VGSRMAGRAATGGEAGGASRFDGGVGGSLPPYPTNLIEI